MEDANYNTKYQQQSQATNPSKFYSHFLYKALIVTIFLVILPLFPSQAPEFVNQTLNTRGWEFLHLIFVGIAVSYGLFSRRNDEAEKDNNNLSKFDNAQSYVSRFLQVSSVFDDEADSPPRSDGTTVQTWNNQYYRNDPVVVVADENSVLDQEQRGTSSRIGEKPLLLPVRSLKSRVLEADGNETIKESSPSLCRSSSNLGSKRISSNSAKSRSGEFGELHHQDLEQKLKDNVVLPSPIPWRSRSGRMEMKETKEEDESPRKYTLPASVEESELNRSFRSQVSRSPRPNSTNSSPKLSPSPSVSSPRKLSPSASFPAEAQGKSAEDFSRKKSFYRSPPTPPPPPPLPQVVRKSQSMKPSSSATDGEDEILAGKDFKRSYRSEPKELNMGGGFSIPTSVGTTRNSDSLSGKKFDDMINTKAEKRFNEVEARVMERGRRKTVGFDQSSFKTEMLNRGRVTFGSQPSFREYPKEEKEEFVEKLVSESDEDLDTEDEDDDDVMGSCFVSGTGTAASSNNEEEATSCSASDGGPDVDKKADEFIAKFREQIRLQRIESIKRSSGQISRKAPR